MNISLVYPSIKNSGWNSLGNTQESLWVNHGLASLAACLERKGHNVRCLDLRDMNSWGQFSALVAYDKANVYGIYMATLDFHEASKAAFIIRKTKNRALIVVGGPHPSICPGDVAKNSVFDHIVVGEGELVFPELIKNHTNFPRIIRGEHPNLDSLPFENREVFNMKKILGASNPISGKQFFPMPFLNVISGRGCVWRCGFCKPGEDMIFGKFRMRGLQNFFGEIEMLHQKYKFKTLMIDDDSFTLNPQYVKDFCDLYEKKIGEKFFCQSRADFICNNVDVVKRLKQAGLDMLFIGFESGSQRMLDLMHKDVYVEQNFRAAEICKSLGIKIWANFMVGLPGETKEEMQATFDMIKVIKPEHPSGSFFTPIVGTHLYDYCVEHDLLVSGDPEVLGCRNPGVPKIKGVDYGWMRKKMYPFSKLWRRVAKRVLLRLTK